MFGLVPALAASGSQVHEALKESGRAGGEGPRGRRLRDVLVAAEVALALLLTIGAGLLSKAFLRLEQVDPGFRSEGLLTASLTLPEQKYSQPAARRAFFAQLLRDLGGLAGVKDAGIVSMMPLGGANSGTSVHLEGHPEPRAEDAPIIWFRSASPGYFRAMGIPLLRGRFFQERDNESVPPVAIINETMARRMWPNEDPLGKRLAFGLSHRPRVAGLPEPPWLTVVGVVGDVRHTSLAQPPEAELFTSYAQTPGASMVLVIRATAGPLRFAPLLRRTVAALDKDLPVSRVAAMEQIVADSVTERRLSTWVLGSFAALAVILAAVGINGLISFSVARRTHEIGVRLALGAAPAGVLRLVLRQGLMPALAGLAAGLVAALLLRLPVQEALLEATAEDQHTTGLGKVPVHPVMFGLSHDFRLLRHLVLDAFIRLALHDHVAPEFAGQHDQRAVQQPALLQVQYQLRNRPVDGLLHSDGPLMAVFVRVPVAERDVLRGDLDETRAGLGQPAGQQAAQPEAARVVDIVGFLRLEREIECLGGRGTQ